MKSWLLRLDALPSHSAIAEAITSREGTFCSQDKGRTLGELAQLQRYIAMLMIDFSERV
jgi:hypothetical protein